jgi:uncharacterized protein DUF4439
MRRTEDALQAALSAEHAAVYGYGNVGARLSGSAQETAALVLDTHRVRRDQLVDFLRARRARPLAAAPAYRLPVRPDSARTAAELAAKLEDQVLTAYVGLAGAPEPELRTFAAKAMQEAITRAVAWRGSPGDTSAFPGLPRTALTPRPDQ